MNHDKDTGTLVFSDQEAKLLDCELTMLEQNVFKLEALAFDIAAVRQDTIDDIGTQGSQSQRGRIATLSQEIQEAQKLAAELGRAARLIYPDLFTDSEL
jgi:hypothetical protein